MWQDIDKKLVHDIVWRVTSNKTRLKTVQKKKTQNLLKYFLYTLFGKRRNWVFGLHKIFFFFSSTYLNRLKSGFEIHRTAISGSLTKTGVRRVSKKNRDFLSMDKTTFPSKSSNIGFPAGPMKPVFRQNQRNQFSWYPNSRTSRTGWTRGMWAGRGVGCTRQYVGHARCSSGRASTCRHLCGGDPGSTPSA